MITTAIYNATINAPGNTVVQVPVYTLDDAACSYAFEVKIVRSLFAENPLARTKLRLLYCASAESFTAADARNRLTRNIRTLSIDLDASKTTQVFQEPCGKIVAPYLYVWLEVPTIADDITVTINLVQHFEGATPLGASGGTAGSTTVDLNVFSKLVTAAGTPEALSATELLVTTAIIAPRRDATGGVYVGFGPTLLDLVELPFVLQALPGKKINLAEVFVDADVSSEGAVVNWF